MSRAPAPDPGPDESLAKPFRLILLTIGTTLAAVGVLYLLSGKPRTGSVGVSLAVMTMVAWRLLERGKFAFGAAQLAGRCSCTPCAPRPRARELSGAPGDSEAASRRVFRSSQDALSMSRLADGLYLTFGMRRRQVIGRTSTGIGLRGGRATAGVSCRSCASGGWCATSTCGCTAARARRRRPTARPSPPRGGRRARVARWRREGRGRHFSHPVEGAEVAARFLSP